MTDKDKIGHRKNNSRRVGIIGKRNHNRAQEGRKQEKNIS